MTNMTDLRAPADLVNRQALCAVELIDPVTRERVWRRIEVRAAGLKGTPIVNRSGRFVFLAEGSAWPSEFTVTVTDPRFMSPTHGLLKRPDDLDHASDRERLMRIELQPTRVYDFGEGVTALRGRLTETPENDSPIAGADVALAWWTDNGWQTAPHAAKTDRLGQFALFARVPPQPDPDLDRGLLLIRVEVAWKNERKSTRDFPFLEEEGLPKDRVPVGLLLYRDISLCWTKLENVSPV